MSAYFLLNLLNNWKKRDTMRGLHNKFDKSINTWAWMLDSIYNMTLKLLDITFLSVHENAKILSYTCICNMYGHPYILNM